MFKALTTKIANNVAIVDAGTTGHFVVPGVPVMHVKVAKNPFGNSFTCRGCTKIYTHLQIKSAMVTERSNRNIY